MAKTIRSIKADLCKDETLGSCTPLARLLFVGLITIVDDHGRFRGAPALVRGEVFPYDDFSSDDVEGWLAELEDKDRIRRYTAEGQQYLVIVRWPKHQRIDNAAKSELPAPPVATPPPTSPNGDPPQPAANVGEDPTPLELPPLEGKGVEGSGEENRAGDVEFVFDAWRDATGKARAKLDHKRRKLIETALKSYERDELIDAVRGWRHSPHHRGENDRQTVYNDLGLILRDAAHIEQFRDLERGEGRGPPAVPKSWSSLQAIAGEVHGGTVRNGQGVGSPRGSLAAGEHQ